MKWVVVAILVCIVPFTYLTLRYRKTAPAFRPYEDMKNRANTSRLLSAGFQRIPLSAQRPADPLGPATSAFIAATGGGLPEELRTTLVEPPPLPAQITLVSAPARIAAADAYTFRFACTMADHKREPAGADLYVKEDRIVIVPDFARISGEFLARSTENIIQLTVPAHTLKPGSYRVTLVGQQASRSWSLTVQ